MRHALSAAEADRFRTDGFVGPFRLCPPDEMVELGARIRAEVLPFDGPAGTPLQSRHQDNPLIHELCTSPAILDRIASLLGPNLILWRSHLFDKPPGSPEVPWHQDINFWPLEPQLNVSAWIAIDPARTENSCMRFIPGSHKRGVPHVAAEPGMLFGEMADPGFFDRETAIDIEAEPGQFFLFNERLLHQSDPNRSDLQRLGLAVRITTPIVKVDHGQLHDRHGVMVVRGRDHMHLNQVIQPPGFASSPVSPRLRDLYVRSADYLQQRVTSAGKRNP